MGVAVVVEEGGHLVGGDQADGGAGRGLLGVEGVRGFLAGEVAVDELPAAVAQQRGPPLLGVLAGCGADAVGGDGEEFAADAGQPVGDGAGPGGGVRHRGGLVERVVGPGAGQVGEDVRDDAALQELRVRVGVQRHGHRDGEGVLGADVEDAAGQEEGVARLQQEVLGLLQQRPVVAVGGLLAAGELLVLLGGPAVEVLGVRAEVDEEGVLVALMDPEGGARVVPGEGDLFGAAQRQAPPVDEGLEEGSEAGGEGGADGLQVVDDQGEPLGAGEVLHPRHEGLHAAVPGRGGQRLGQEVVAAVLADVDAGVRLDAGLGGVGPADGLESGQDVVRSGSGGGDDALEQEGRGPPGGLVGEGAGPEGLVGRPGVDGLHQGSPDVGAYCRVRGRGGRDAGVS